MKDNEILETSRNIVIDTIAQNMNLYGISPSAGRLYGVLFYSEHPLTLDEMKEEVGMSKTSMSNAIKSLLDLNLVEKILTKGVRKNLYKINEDWYQSFFDYFTIKWRKAVKMNDRALEKSISQLKELITAQNTSKEARERAQKDIEKLEARLDYYDWQNKLINSFETGEIFNFITIDKKINQED